MDAALLLAGFGTRLKPLTLWLPKPMIPVLGKPLYLHTVNQLEAQGVKVKAANCHHLAQKMAESLDDHNIQAVVEKEIRGTGGGILGLMDHLQSDPFLIGNGDIIWDADLLAAQKHFLDFEESLACLMVFPNKGGEVFVSEDGRVIRIHDHHLAGNSEKESWRGTFTGIHLLKQSIRRSLPQKDSFCIVRELYFKLLSKGMVICAHPASNFVDLGTLQQFFSFHKKEDDGSFVVKNQFLGEEKSVFGSGKIINGKGSNLKDVLVLGEVEVPDNRDFSRGIFFENSPFLQVRDS